MNLLPDNPRTAESDQPLEPTAPDARWWVLVTTGIGTFMTALDTSVVNTTLPLIQKDLHSSVAGVEWVVTIYLLLLSGLLLSFGRLGDLRGHKPVYVLGFGTFMVSSIVAGLAPNVPVLVACRAMQALGGAMLAANSPAILTKSFPASQRGRALGLQATMTYLGLTVGPSLGGWIASQFGWRYVFYINVPVCLAAVIMSLRFVPHDTPRREEKFDIPGALAFLVGLSALLLGLNQGHNWGWGSPRVLVLLLGAGFLLAVFIYIERRAPSPMLDLSLFQRPQFSLSVTTAVLNYICVYSSIFLLPFYLIQGRGFSSAEAGLLLTAQPIIMAIVAPLSGTLSDRIGAQIPGAVGMGMLSIGMFLLSRLGPQSPQISIILALVMVGLGTGIFISPNNSALMGAAPRHRQGIAAGTLATARNFGMVLGVGLAGAIFTTIVSQGITGLAGEVQVPPLFVAIQISFLAASLIAAMGVVTSLIRGNHATNHS